jgi:peptidoglycan/LPS O-acetylase OafA/YrhL
MDANRAERIPTLDGWRAIAVGLVIGAHSIPMLRNNGTAAAQSLAALFGHAGYGVDVFFCLSGFLICGQLLSEKETTETISLSRFYVRRAFRILPPILLYLAIIVLLSWAELLPHIDSREIWGTLFFYRNYLRGSWYLGHFWSLAVEEQFYAVIPVFLLLVNRRWAVRGAFALIALCIGIRWFEYAHGWFPEPFSQYRTENRVDGLMWGCLLAAAMQTPAARAWLQKRLTGPVFFALVAILVLLLVGFDSPPSHRTLVAAFMPFLVAHTVLHADGFMGRMLELSALKWVGRLSYSLYIWQMVFLVPHDRPLGVLQAFPLNLTCALICASLSYYLLEKPMIKIGRRLGSPSARPLSIQPPVVG